jgi:hypothetical protein
VPYQDPNSKRASFTNTNHKKSELKNKIREIIDLCKDENASVTRDLSRAAETEEGIYNLLKGANVAAGENPVTSTSNNYAPSANYTPIRGSHNEEAANPAKNLQQDIRAMLSRNGNVQLSEEALQLIDEIERRCLA